MDHIYILRAHKVLKCTLLAVVLIVSFHLIFIARGTFQRNSKVRITQKLNWLQNNAPIVVSKLCNKETTAEIFHSEEIRKFCSHNTVDLMLPQSHHFLANHQHKLLYCWIHKVASTSWIALFSHLANRTHISEYYREIKILSPKSTEELHRIAKTKDYHKLLVVRHPFQRLVSAYRDRIEDTSKFTSQAWIYVPRIFALTRPSLNESLIFDTNHQHKISVVPTFQEFVKWLLVIPPNKYDVHWNRYSDHCSPCHINYDTVIKMDDFSKEEEISLMCKMGLKHLNVSFPHLQQTSGGSTDFHVTCQYFQQLIPEQVKALYAIYHIDFEMFNYSPQPYINCAQMKSSLTNMSASNATIQNVMK